VNQIGEPGEEMTVVREEAPGEDLLPGDVAFLGTSFQFTSSQECSIQFH
jgi:hypothetical protein